MRAGYPDWDGTATRDGVTNAFEVYQRAGSDIVAHAETTDHPRQPLEVHGPLPIAPRSGRHR